MNNSDKAILIVDAIESMRSLLITTLKSKGYNNFFFAENGVEALSVCRDEIIDLILTNWDMPKMDGLELLKNIRAMDRTQHIPLLMITTETDENKVVQAIHSGVNDFIVKPFTPKLLHQKLELVFSGKLPFIKNRIKKKEDISKAASTDNKAEKAKILVVDDLPSNIDVIVGILKGTYQIRIATNGKKALEISASTPPPDLILLDIMMPELSRP